DGLVRCAFCLRRRWRGCRDFCFGPRLSGPCVGLGFRSAVGEIGSAELIAESAELFIIRRDNRHNAAVLRDGEVTSPAILRDLLPGFLRPRNVSALNGVDDHAFAPGFDRGLLAIRLILLICVRRGVAYTKYDLPNPVGVP